MSEELIEAPQKRTGLFVAIVAGVVFAVTRGGDDGETVRIGVVGASDPYWETYRQAAADEGITVEIVDFTDYAQPNPALAEGELDLNQFQHIVYLADYNVSNTFRCASPGTGSRSSTVRSSTTVAATFSSMPAMSASSAVVPRASRRLFDNA